MELLPITTASLGAMGPLAGKLDALQDTKLKKEMSKLATRLLKLSKARDPPHTARRWMEDVRQLAYDMENCVDTEADWIRKMPRMFELRVKEANRRYDKYNLETVPCPIDAFPIIDHRLPMVADGGNTDPVVVGLHDKGGAVDTLCGWLADDGTKELKVASIVGAGGIGKTTLAKQLWRGNKLGEFQCRAFVRTAKKPDMRRILRSILAQVRPHQPPDSDEVHQLIHGIREHLRDKRYFLIMDDVWATSAWDVARRALPGSNASRIITTTEIEDVALACCSYQSKYIFKMEPLSVSHSQELFTSGLFGPLDKLSDEIIRRCAGLPQAIITMSSVLASQRETNTVGNLEQIKNSLPINTPSVEILKQVLNFCYNCLPGSLQTCLLHLTLYPENYIILKEDIVKQWIAEGFILAPTENDKMKLAESYFDKLVRMGLIQHIDVDHSDDVLYYAVHHTVNVLITSKSTEHNFIAAIDYSQRTVRFPNKVSRMSLQFGSATYATKPDSIGLSQVRTLAFIGLKSCLPSILEFKLLRLLTLHMWADQPRTGVDLKPTSGLVLLRSLQVTCNDTVHLPDLIQGPKHLETLGINAVLAAIPANIVHLRSWLHLRLGVGTELPDVTGILKNATLNPPISLDESSSPPNSVMSIELLSPICSIPKWIGQLTNLLSLKIVVRELADISNLQGLPFLTILSLRVQRRNTELIIFATGAFAALECFEFRCGVLRLIFQKGAMPSLRSLKLGFNAHRGEPYGVSLVGIEDLLSVQKISGIIGVATGAKIHDFKAAESAFKKAMGKHSSKVSIKIADMFEQECAPPDSIEEKHQQTPSEQSVSRKPETQEPDEKQHSIRKEYASTSSEQTGSLAQESQEDISQNADGDSQSIISRRYKGKYVTSPPTNNQEVINFDNIMAGIMLLRVIEKIEIALEYGGVRQYSAQLSKYATIQFNQLQCNMARVVSELRVMHDILCHMDIRNHNDLVYERWLDEVHKGAHRMEDMVDEYLHQVGREHDMGCCFYLNKGFRKPRSLLSLNQIASKMKEIEKDLAHLSETKNRWVPMVNEGDTSSLNYIVKRSQDLANSSRSLDEEDLVGVDKNICELQQWLGGEDGECSVIITLYGMGGLGKTALAANVYRKEREKFQCHAWVSISQTYSREDVLRNIIMELFKDRVDLPSNITMMDITCLKDTLKRFLEQKKYLIVLDDVWTPEAFDDLSRALLCNDKGSRLLITTREGDVAALATQGHIFTLKALPEDKAWDLFCKKSFSRETNHECPDELKPLSDEIVTKCKGLPLAIVSIGSLLHRREKTVDEWRRINDQLSWEINNNSRLDHTRNVLHLSFMYLPTYLKSCFLYCSLFPEDYLFHRKKLVRLLMAEGFIVEKGASTLEEVAEGYLKELVNRNMLQLVGRNSFGRMNRFRMHDILHELAIDLWQKDHFGVKYEGGSCGGSLQRDGRRLVVQKLKKDMHQSLSSVHGLRTFITLDENMPSFTLLPLLYEKSRYMTVLELSGLPIEKIPDSIGDLFNLRHLGLRGTKVKLLPKSIEKLSNLLTLDLDHSDIQEVPAGIVKLKNLRHLFVEKRNDPYCRVLKMFTGVCIDKGLGQLANLHTLQAVEAHDESVRQLGELRQLRSLRILNVKGIYCERLCESLVKMPFLSFLDVCASDENEVLTLSAIPPNLQKLSLRGRLAEGALLGESPLIQAVKQSLYALHLIWSQLREDPLPSLSRLANLTVLRFTRAYNGDKLVFLTGWFPKLKQLYLGDLPNLKQLEINQGAMSTLEKLTLSNLSSMEVVPCGLEFLMPLRYLLFRDITRDFLMTLSQYPGIANMHLQYTLRD